MDAPKKFPSIPAGQLALKLRRHSLIVQVPLKMPGWSVAYPSYKPGDVVVYPVLKKDMQVSGKLAEIIRRRLNLESRSFWPEW